MTADFVKNYEVSTLKSIGMKKYLDILPELERVKEQGINITTYCEPFAGSFNVGLKVGGYGLGLKLVLNDLDSFIYDYWICIKENPKKMYDRIVNLSDKLNNTDENDEILHILAVNKHSSNKFDRAAFKWVLSRFLGTKGLIVRELKYKDLDFNIECNSLSLSGADILNLDYIEVFEKYDSEETFFLLDPPYYIPRVGGYYSCESEFFYHKEFSDYVKKLKGKWLLTYNNSDYIKELFKEYNQESIKIDMFGLDYSELYIRNY